jgi:hypothetical protein
MKNDMTWERSASSEQNKQQVASSLGKLVGQRSKTSDLGSLVGHPAPSQGKTSSLSINREAVLTLLTRKNYLVKQIVKLRDTETVLPQIKMTPKGRLVLVFVLHYNIYSFAIPLREDIG